MHSAASVCYLLDNILTLVVICQSHFFFSKHKLEIQVLDKPLLWVMN